MKKIFAAAALTLIAAGASAADKGWYVGADLGSTQFKIEGETENKGAFGIFGGYKLNDYVAFEAAVRGLGAWEVNALNVNTKVTASALQLSVLGTLPVADSILLFGRLGLGRNSMHVTWNNTTTTEGSTEGLLGLGAQFQINKHFGLRAEYAYLGENTIGDGSSALKLKISQINIGAHYSF